MSIVLGDYVRHLNHIRYTVPETDNDHDGTRQNHLFYTIQHEGGHTILIFDKCLYLRGRLRLTARRLSAYMQSRALATNTTSSGSIFDGLHFLPFLKIAVTFANFQIQGVYKFGKMKFPEFSRFSRISEQSFPDNVKTRCIACQQSFRHLSCKITTEYFI